MPYFSPTFTQFLKDLAANNSTAWFNDNRKIYEKEVKKPFADFVQEMIGRIRQHEPEVQIKPGDAIMRINKDIRFSKDKTPYNTHVAANISPFGKKDKSYPGFYFQLSPEHIKVFGGAYMIEPATLQKIRSFISRHPGEFSGTYTEKQFREKFGEIRGEQHKRLPEEFQQVAAKEPLIANKQFYYDATLDTGLITANDLPEVLMQYYHAGSKLNSFLRDAMK